jgi:glycosyltransferase involved in cell wall biosynthesis
MAGISIALATHNGEKYLEAQLASLAAQTRLPAELVISDDCSNDRTVEIANAFAARAPFPVRIFRSEAQLGFRDNFLLAARYCEADLIAFCDQDDIWEAEKLAVMERVFDDPQVLLAYHNATLISAKGGAVGEVYRGGVGVEIFPPLTRHPWLVVPGFLQVFRRDLTRFSPMQAASYDVDWPGEPLAHDRWFFFLASVLGQIAFVRQSLVRYRQHRENVYGFYPDKRAHFDRLVRGEHFLRESAIAAANRSELLNRMQFDLMPQWRHGALQGATYYDRLRQRLEARTAVYAAPSYLARGKAFYALVRSGAYGKAHGTARFTWLDLLVDANLAIPFGPRLRRLSRGQQR